jgi:hypothetical protein
LTLWGAGISAFIVPVSAIYSFFTSPSSYTDFSAVKMWFFLAIGLGLASLVLNVVGNQLAKSEKREEEEERRRIAASNERDRLAAKDADDQRNFFKSVNEANAGATALLDRLPGHLEEAIQSLAQAERDWNERIYNPFWTSIEDSVLALAQFRDDVEGIDKMAGFYQRGASMYNGPVPPFSVTSISVEAMNSYRDIYDSIAKYTRRALGDIEFATIYEGWRGNRIMAAGFADMRTAINQMSDRISSEISSLDSSLRSISNEVGSLSASMSMQSQALETHVSNASSQNAALLRTAEESVRNEKKIARRLWNIEHGFKSVY